VSGSDGIVGGKAMSTKEKVILLAALAVGIALGLVFGTLALGLWAMLPHG